jgi:hypothetical protein
MDKILERVKQEFEENPMQAILISAFAMTATAKLIDALSAARGRRAYARQVDYRIRRGR